MNKEEKKVLNDFNDELRQRVKNARSMGITHKVITFRCEFGTSTLKCWLAGRYNFKVDKALRLDEVLGGFGF